MRRARLLFPALLGLLAAMLGFVAAAPLPPGTSTPPKVAVSIENYAFQPDPITITAGTTVVWTNRDEVTHTVVSAGKLFASPELETNHSYEFTFHKTGTFPYSCTLHPEMKGKVIVK